MNIAVSSICWRHDTLPEAVAKAHTCGFQAFEVLTFPPEIFPLHGNLRELRAADLTQLLADHDMTLAALHLGAINTSSETRRRTLTDYAKRAIEVAAETGCRLIVEGGPNRAHEPFLPFLRSLDELVPLLEAADVRMALENHHGNWIQYIQDYEHIFDYIDSPWLGITLDTGHFTSAGVDPADVARHFPSKIYHVHIKDHRATESVALGTGETNNIGMVQILKQTGYAGYLSQELELHNIQHADRVACEGLAYMRMLSTLEPGEAGL